MILTMVTKRGDARVVSFKRDLLALQVIDGQNYEDALNAKLHIIAHDHVK
jgi:hypothetical protein